MKNYLVKVDAEGAATAEERTVFQAVGDSVQSLISTDSASVGLVSTLTTAAITYGAMVAVKHRHTGVMSFNPF